MTSLADARVLVIGAGGIGCPLLLALAQAGLRQVTLIDEDRVETSNLHRQILYGVSDVGKRKVEAAKARLEGAFPNLLCHVIDGRFTSENGSVLLRAHDLALEGTDSPATKFLCNDLCIAAQRPFVIGAAIGWRGQVFCWSPEHACYRCLFEAPPPEEDALTCAVAGVAGPICGLVAGIVATSGLALLGRPVAANAHAAGPGQLVDMDGWRMAFRTLAPLRRRDCSACGSGVQPGTT